MRILSKLILLLLLSLPLTELQAQSPNGRKLLIIHLRGGADALAMLQVVNQTLDERRPALYRDPADLLMLPSRPGYLNEGFHSRMPIMQTLFNANELAIVRKVSYGGNTTLPDLAYLAATHGAPALNQIPPNGWLQRLASMNPSYSSSFHAFDHSWERESFAGGNFQPVAIRSYDSVDYYERDDSRDVPFRADTAYALIGSWGINGQLDRESFIKTGKQASGLLDSLRDSLGVTDLPPMGGGADRYPGNSAGYALRDAEYSLINFPSRIVFTEIRGFATDYNQREALYYQLNEFSVALAALRTRLINANRWNNTAILITTESGRSIPEKGDPADYDWQNPWGIGTSFGGAFDVYVTGGAARAQRVSGYIKQDLYADQAEGYFHILDVYASLLQGLGYSASGVIPAFKRHPLKLLK